MSNKKEEFGKIENENIELKNIIKQLENNYCIKTNDT